MSGRLIVVTGTDTGIGKTHVATAILLGARARGLAAFGYKPVESGVDGVSASDADRLLAASSAVFHVKPPMFALQAPVSPHLAAESENALLPWEAIGRWIDAARSEAFLLVELPGGLFTPLTATMLNVDAIAQLHPDVVLLVAPDKLGVLNHVIGSLTAAHTRRVDPDAVVLVTPEVGDPSTGTNGRELRRFISTTVTEPLPRLDVAELAAHPILLELSRRWLAR